jgi:hypothetical protein
MPRFNKDAVLQNISEALEELERIETILKAAKTVNQIEFQINMQHAFHHLNFAWNARHWTKRRYASFSRADFESAGSFPTDLAFSD